MNKLMQDWIPQEEWLARQEEIAFAQHELDHWEYNIEGCPWCKADLDTVAENA